MQGTIIGGVNKRRGNVMDSETNEGQVNIVAHVPLGDMFGYSSELRAATQGKGEFTMEYLRHDPVLPSHQAELIKAYQEELRLKNK